MIWVAATVALMMALVMLIHTSKLGRAWKDEDWDSLRRIDRVTMPLIGVWQITLGISMLFIGPERTWQPTITLVGCGLGLLFLAWMRRKLDRAWG